MVIDGHLMFHNCIVNGELTLYGTHLTGELVLNGTRVTVTSGSAVLASGLTVEHALRAQHGFVCEGEFEARGATVGGGMFLEAAKLSNRNGYALAADGLVGGADHAMQLPLCRGGHTTAPRCADQRDPLLRSGDPAGTGHSPPARKS